MTDFSQSPLVIAHRGASSLAPENTLASFKRAIEEDAEGIEFDIRITKDGVPIVFHDSHLARIARQEGRVSNFIYEELQDLDIGSWFNEKNPEKANQRFSQERIPTLKETLNFLGGYKGIIYIELKCKGKEVKDLSEALCRVIKHSRLLPQIIVKSFKLDSIPYIKKRCPEVKTAALFAPKVMTIIRKEKRLINISKELGVDFLSLHFSLVTKKLVDKAVAQNLKVAIWTVDKSLWVRRGMKLGISHLISNNPALLLAKRNDLIQTNRFLT